MSESLPQIGFGTFKIKSKDPITNAIDAGYRHIDTAEYYENEQLVKEAIDSCPDKVHVTTKISKNRLSAMKSKKVSMK